LLCQSNLFGGLEYVYFSYSKANRRMEVRTRGPLDPGKYEALVNYDDPYYLSGYWTKERRNVLPPETLARLQATYPAKIRASRKIDQNQAG
jgi:hypothetical protein